MTRFCSIGVLVGLLASTAVVAAEDSIPNWIWNPAHHAGEVPQGKCYFRRTLDLAPVSEARLFVAADDHFEVYLNGRRIGQGTARQGIRQFEVTDYINRGQNTLAVEVQNRHGSTAGLAAKLQLSTSAGHSVVIVTDEQWKASPSALPLWNREIYSDRRWKQAKNFGPFPDFVTQQIAAAKTARQPIPARRPSRDPQSGSGPFDASGNRTDTVIGSKIERKLNRPDRLMAKLQVPREFEIQHIAAHQDAGSLVAMTFNEFGHIIAARENGTLLLIRDQNEDGQYDRYREYYRGLKACQGLLALSGKIYAVGTGSDGNAVYVLEDSDHDGQLDQSTTLLRFTGENLEHGAHGITLGPDGYLYVVVGNHAQLKDPAAASSPYRHIYEGDVIKPRFEDPGGHARGIAAPGGFIVRLDPEGKRVEMIAGGLRNAYDLTFDAQGELFVHDSDMESDRGTTWYRPTRLYHVVDGAEFGWRSGWSKWPEYYIDAVPGLLDTGRGSPTGIVCYDDDAYPDSYRDAMFSCDWSEGRILVIKNQQQDATHRAVAREFVRGRPLNVTDIDVGPDGNLYFCTGGRGTAGNIYRVRWKGESEVDETTPTFGIEAALRQTQLGSAWARQRIAELRASLKGQWSLQLRNAVLDKDRPVPQRLQAWRIMHWIGPKPTDELMLTLSHDTNLVLRRSATYSLGLTSSPATGRRLVELTGDPDAIVRRRALEALARREYPISYARIEPSLASDDWAEAWAARQLLHQMSPERWHNQVVTNSNLRVFLQGSTAILVDQPNTAITDEILQRCMQLMDRFLNDRDFVDMLRVLQLAVAHGDLADEVLPRLKFRLAEEYPSSSLTINRELIRLLARLQVTSIADRYVQQLESDMPLEEQVHLAMHLATIEEGWDAAAKLRILQKLDVAKAAGSGVPGYLQAAAQTFSALLEDEELTAALQQPDRWPAAALAAVLAMPEKLSDTQIDQIKSLDSQLTDTESLTTERLQVAVVAVLARDGSEKSMSYLLEIYDREPTRRVEVALGLAHRLNDENWIYLVRSLPILDPPTAKEVIAKLRTYRKWPENAEPYRHVLLTAKRLGDQGAWDAISLLEHWQGLAAKRDGLTWQMAVKAWQAWFAETYPTEQLATVATAETGNWDAESLLAHLHQAELNDQGDTRRGRDVFVKAQCASCHRLGNLGENIGPDLTGIYKRFLKREMLDSLLHPSAVVSDQYLAKVVVTNSGKTITGIVSETPDGHYLVLQSTGKKVRLPRDEVDEMITSRLSVMPEGLLNTLTLEEITDLFAFMMSDGTGDAKEAAMSSEGNRRNIAELEVSGSVAR